MELLNQFKTTLESYDPSQIAVGVDFETYYDDDYSVSGNTYWHYCHDPRFDAYMVSVYCPILGIDYVGPPGGFNWYLIEGLLWCAHNSPFDRAVWERLVELNTAPKDARPMAWVNTADLAAYNYSGRSLKAATRILLNRHRSKQVRSDMKGRKYRDLDAETQKQWLDYAMDDAVDCYDLWEKYSPEWPLIEQRLSLHTSECVSRGVAVDTEKVEENIEALQRAISSSESKIPWAGEQELTPKTKKPRFKKGQPVILSPTSPKQLAIYAREQGIPLPSSTSVKSEEFQAWQEEYGKRLPVIKSMQTWRKCNRLLKIFEQIKEKTRPDGRMELQICYFGAQSTGRWAGKPGGGASRVGEDEETGLNMQNLSKETLYLNSSGELVEENDPDVEYIINLRSMFIAQGEGKTLCISDLSQIEPRVLAKLAGDESFLNEIRKGQSPYEAHARTSMGWTGGDLKKQSPPEYAFAKARVLSLGFQAAWQKFIAMAAMYINDQVIFDQIFTQPVQQSQINDFLDYQKRIKRDDIVNAFSGLDQKTQCVWVNSWLQVMDYRAGNPLITQLWAKLQKHFKIASTRKEDYFITLPSGRRLGYFEPRNYDQKATRTRGGARTNVYGGLLTENATQATARDVFGEGIIRLELAGYPVIWHVHDEVIVETDADADVEAINNLLAQPPTWMPDLPVAAEGELSPHYKK